MEQSKQILTLKNNLDSIRGYIKEEFGDRCREYVVGCRLCEAYRMLDDLQEYLWENIEWEE